MARAASTCLRRSALLSEAVSYTHLDVYKRQAILLDVTTGTGAFMKTVDQSIELAKLMVAIGTHHGRRVAAIITDMRWV